MFIYSETVEFEWPVAVQIPVGGSYEEFQFTGRFLMLPEDDVKDENFDMTAAIKRVWIGWSGIQTPDGKPLEYSEENRATLLRQAPIHAGVWHAYLSAITGAVRGKK